MPTEPSAKHGQDCTIANPCRECRTFMERKPMDAEKALADAHAACGGDPTESGPASCEWPLCKDCNHEHLHRAIDALARAAFEDHARHVRDVLSSVETAQAAFDILVSEPLPKWLTETSR